MCVECDITSLMIISQRSAITALTLTHIMFIFNYFLNMKYAVSVVVIEFLLTF